MKQITKEVMIQRIRTLLRRLTRGAMAATIIGFILPAMAAPPLPREPMPKPTLPGTYQGAPRPPVHIGARPKFNPSNVGVLPDLKIVRVTTRINSRVMGICRTGRKARPQSSIEVLNFDLEVKNVGRGTAYMNRDGVIVSAQTMDFHERVFDTSKYYLGGRGGPGHFMGPHGRQNWILKRMAHVKPGKTFKATSHLGIGYNNEIFTINRLRELAGQTHRFRIKLTSYGRPGLKESNIRNNEYIVSYTFPRNFCTNQVVDGINTPIGNDQTVKPNISGFQFAGGKRCIAPGGIFTIKGSAFGSSAGSRTIELGGNGLGVNLAIKSWNSRTIRVQLPRAARLQYRKNYWVRIQAPAVAGAARTLSNLKRGVVLCPPTVHAGGSGSSGNQSAGQQNGGRGINVQTGLPDLIISRLVMVNPSPGCFAYSDGAGNKKFYKLAPIATTITLKNIGPVSYSTRDRSRNKQLAIGIIGDRFVGRPDRRGYSLCAVPISNVRLSNLNIPAGSSKTIRTKLVMEVCKVPKKGAVKKRTTRLPQSLVNTLLGRSRSINIGVGKAVFIKNKIPQEGNYNNNFQRSVFRFPNRICRGR